MSLAAHGAGQASVPVAKVLLYDLGSLREELNEPIGLGCLKSFLDLKHPGLAKTTSQLFPINPLPSAVALAGLDIVGVSTRLRSLARLQIIVEALRSLPQQRRPMLVLGDLMATFATSDLLCQLPEAICVLGEGEEPFAAIVENWARAGGNVDQMKDRLLREQIPNLAFIHHNRSCMTRKALVELDNMPPPDRILTRELIRKGGIIRVENSRGCAWDRCSFCAIKSKYGGIGGRRQVSIARAVSELETLSAMGVRNPYYTDEDFVGDDRGHGVELAWAISRARQEGRIHPEMGLYINLRVANITARKGMHGPAGVDLLVALKHAGLREVFLGIESGTASQVKRYAKAATARTNLQAIETVRRLGLDLDLGFIMFDPEMTLAELHGNLQFIDQAGIRCHDACLTGALRVQAGTPILKEYQDKDLITGPMDVNDLAYPYRYLDSCVAAIQTAFSAWQSRREDAVYTIQAATRGEIESEAIRRALRKHLGQIRSAELAALQALVQVALDGRSPAKTDLTDWTECREESLGRAYHALRQFGIRVACRLEDSTV